MIDREVGDEAFVQQIGIERGQLLGQEHALVDHRAAAQRADIEIVDVLFQQAPFDAPADDVEVAFKVRIADAAPVIDHDLLDLGPRGVGLFADDGGVDRHLAPAVDVVTEVQDFGLDDGAAGLLGRKIVLGQKHHADREPALGGFVTRAGNVFLEEDLRDLHVDAGAVAGLAVGVDGAAVPDRLERIDARHDHGPPGLTIDRRNQADAAGIVLVGRIVKALGLQPAGVFSP